MTLKLIYFNQILYYSWLQTSPAPSWQGPYSGTTHKNLQSLWHSAHQEMKSISLLLVWEGHGAVLNNQGWQKRYWLAEVWMVMQFLWYLLGVLSLESRCRRSPPTLRPVCCEGAKRHGKTMCPRFFGISILSHPRHTADTSEHMSARLQPSDIQFCLRNHVFPAESQTLLDRGLQNPCGV